MLRRVVIEKQRFLPRVGRLTAMPAMRPALIAASVAFASSAASSATPSWSCTPVRPPLPLATGAVWYSINCTSGPYPTWGNFGPVVVNVIMADLSTANLQLLPLAALPTPGANGTNETLAALDVIASQHNGTVPTLLGGINGGYFWRLDITPLWVDDVCLGGSSSWSSWVYARTRRNLHSLVAP